MNHDIARSSPADDGPVSPVARLSVVDLMFLRVESAAWPCHFGGLAVLDGAHENRGVRVDRSSRVIGRCK